MTCINDLLDLFSAVVHQGLIGIGIPKLGFIDGTKQTCIKSWKVSWSSYVAKLSFFP